MMASLRLIKQKWLLVCIFCVVIFPVAPGRVRCWPVENNFEQTVSSLCCAIFLQTMEYLVNWDMHERNISEAFHSLRKDEHFCDVTLACGDLQFQAHKVVLSTGSSFFEQILKSHKHPNPLLYLKGVEANHMELLLDFMYCGEVFVTEEELKSLIRTAEELGVRGLTSTVPSTTFNSPDSNRNNSYPDHTSNCKEPTGNSFTPVPEASFPQAPDIVPVLTNSFKAAASIVGEVIVKIEELQSDADIDGTQHHKVKDWEDLRRFVISSCEKDSSGKAVRSHKCSLCGKIWSGGHMWDMMAHVESMHFKGALTHTCSICQKACVTKHSLIKHKKTKHKYKNNPTNDTPSSPQTSKFSTKPVPINNSMEAAASEEENKMFGDSETTVKSESSQLDANFDGTCVIKEWEDFKRYVISTSVKDSSGKEVKIHQCSLCGEAWQQGKLHVLMAHIESRHFKGALIHTCSICQQTCTTKHILTMHRKKHKNKKV